MFSTRVDWIMHSIFSYQFSLYSVSTIYIGLKECQPFVWILVWLWWSGWLFSSHICVAICLQLRTCKYLVPM